MLKLHSYFRSSAAYRVRVALNLKNLDYDTIPVHLINNGGEQHSDTYHSLNPFERVPTFIHDQHTMQQSLSIIEYLEEQFPTPALLPESPKDRATVRGLAMAIACDIHPLNNLSVLQFLKSEFDISQEQQQQWYSHWITTGFSAFEEALTQLGSNGDVCFGDTVTLADLTLIPQVYNAKRFNIDTTCYPLINSIDKHCNGLPAFQRAAPEHQIDSA